MHLLYTNIILFSFLMFETKKNYPKKMKFWNFFLSPPLNDTQKIKNDGRKSI